jgi:hypothetical protein
MIDISHIAFNNRCTAYHWAPIVRVSENVWKLLSKNKKHLDLHAYDMLFMSCCPTANKINTEFDGRKFEFYLSNRRRNFIRFLVNLDYPAWIFCLPEEMEQVISQLKSIELIPISNVKIITA